MLRNVKNHDVFSDESLRKEYRVYRAEKTNAAIPWLTIAFAAFNVVFAFSDRYLRHMPVITYGRIIPTIFALVLCGLYCTKKLRPQALNSLQELWYLSGILMLFWISYITFDTEIYKASITALMMGVFVTAVSGTSVTKKLAFIYFFPFALFIAGILVKFGPENRLIEMGNYVAMSIICLILNQLRERLAFSEFKLKHQLESTIQELKTTQTQLIQSEKMASLGELTAGVAHEIQNPLNFINNFSEMNVDLVHELEVAQQMPVRNAAYEAELFRDIKQNAEKVLHHGKRADAIVKGMLQHSRKSTGQKEPTNINALADEYLRLSYHGLRAKDKAFNASIKTEFDESIGKVNIVPQDIGRVLLNLFNNAFYAVQEQAKSDDAAYTPTIWVSTKKLPDKIEIVVQDNGKGIPKSVMDKIFQPFFTTKPTGQGTGLGLSLSYDIVKAHGGTINVKSSEGQGTSFTITLPL